MAEAELAKIRRILTLMLVFLGLFGIFGVLASLVVGAVYLHRWQRREPKNKIAPNDAERSSA